METLMCALCHNRAAVVQTKLSQAVVLVCRQIATGQKVLPLHIFAISLLLLEQNYFIVSMAVLTRTCLVY